jgi:enediyne biosynthesis protein E4
VHFGLGKQTQVSTIDIRWPSGITQALTDVRADQILQIDEPVLGRNAPAATP